MAEVMAFSGRSGFAGNWAGKAACARVVSSLILRYPILLKSFLDLGMYTIVSKYQAVRSIALYLFYILLLSIASDLVRASALAAGGQRALPSCRARRANIANTCG